MEQMDKRQVLRRLSMAGCIGLMRTVLQDDAEGKSRQYPRTVTPLPGNNLLGFMPAYLGTGRLFWSQGNYCFSRAITRLGCPPTRAAYCCLTPSTALCDLWLTATPSPRSAPARSVL